jgi:heme exporter protein CcmD
MSLSEFLHMGGYGGYVWSCFGMTLAMLIGMDWTSRRRLTRTRKAAERRATIAAGRP